MGPDDEASTSRTAIGRQAESLAARFLLLRGYRILAANVRDGPREIDLIAHRRRVIAIVEVRFRSRDDFGDAEETVRFRKRRDLLRAGRAWWLLHGRALGRLRFDLITLKLRGRGLVLRHFPDFLSPGS